MSPSTRREAPTRASLGSVVSRLATDLAAARGELEAVRSQLARRESELAAAEAASESALRAAQILTRENEALVDAQRRSEGTLGLLHESFREQARLRSRQHKALAAADEDRAWLLDLVDRALTQLTVLEQRPSRAARLLGAVLGTAEPAVPERLALPPRGRTVLLLALGLTANEVRGVVALAIKDIKEPLLPVVATDTPLGASPVPTIPLPRPGQLRRLPAETTAEAYLRQRVTCLCRRLVPARIVAFGAPATRLLADLRAAGEQLELTAPATDPSGHTPTDAAPS